MAGDSEAPESVAAGALDSVAEGVPLLPAPSAPKYLRRWRNSWGMLFGDGSPSDVAACCLSYHAPCVSFGWNHSRGLQLSFWRELARFILFTLGAFVLVKVACCAVVMVSCPPPAMGAMMPGNSMGAAMAGTTAGATMPGNTGGWGMGHDHAHGPHDRDHDHGPHDHFDHPHPDPMMDRECARRAVPGLVIVFLMGLALIAYFVNFAARRRQALRERFGIEGTFGKDLTLWACCSLCALTQETRTLMHEQVHEGVWYGALPTASDVAVAPAKQCIV